MSGTPPPITDFRFALPADEASRDRLAELGQLAGSLVHELKNPLGAIELNLEMVQVQLGKEELDRAKLDKRLERIQQSSRHLRDIIESYLAFCRPGRPKHDRVDVNELMREVLDEQREVLDLDDIEVVFKPGDGLRAVPADPHQLRSCFLNIILNGRDALHQRPADRRIVVATRNRRDAVSVVIANNGPPLGGNAAAHLFEPFFSDKEGGTGLGLAIVARLVEMHHGKVEVHSDPAQGVSFTIDLPTTLGLAKARAELPLPDVEASIHEPTPSESHPTAPERDQSRSEG